MDSTRRYIMKQEADKIIDSNICYRIYQQGVSKMMIEEPQNTMHYYNIGYNECYNISQQQQKYDPCNLHW